jgi:hypothetical protein
VSDLVDGRVQEANFGETFVQIYIQVIICSLQPVSQKTVGLICYEPHYQIVARARSELYEGLCVSSVTHFVLPNHVTDLNEIWFQEYMVTPNWI